MKTNLHVVFFASIAALATVACDGDYDRLTGGRQAPPGSGEGVEQGEGTNPALECTVAPDGRSYVHFDGAKLEDSRANENVGVNRARVKPHATLAKEFKRVLGVEPPSLKGASGSFDVPPARWYGEAQYSAVSLHAMATISFEGCLAYVEGKPAFAVAPTADSAKSECAALMRKAWSRSPSPEEIAGCADLAVGGVAEEPDVARRWAYACTSVLSSSQFLTF